MKRLFLAMIRFYQRHISPALPARCRFLPTCSAYAVEAIERFGAWKGGWLALKRLLRCHPFYRGPMYDPVPENYPGHTMRDLFRKRNRPGKEK